MSKKQATQTAKSTTTATTATTATNSSNLSNESDNSAPVTTTTTTTATTATTATPTNTKKVLAKTKTEKVEKQTKKPEEAEEIEQEVSDVDGVEFTGEDGEGDQDEDVAHGEHDEDNTDVANNSNNTEKQVKEQFDYEMVRKLETPLNKVDGKTLVQKLIVLGSDEKNSLMYGLGQKLYRRLFSTENGENQSQKREYFKRGYSGRGGNRGMNRRDGNSFRRGGGTVNNFSSFNKSTRPVNQSNDEMDGESYNSSSGFRGRSRGTNYQGRFRGKIFNKN